jgi:hypothetical protein
MKKLVLIIGILSMILNTIALLTFSNYYIINFWLVSFSIITTTGLIYISNSSKNADAYKIGLTFIYSILGIVMFFLSLASSPVLKNNILIMILFGIVIIEIIILLTIQYMRKHN